MTHPTDALRLDQSVNLGCPTDEPTLRQMVEHYYRSHSMPDPMTWAERYTQALAAPASPPLTADSAPIPPSTGVADNGASPLPEGGGDTMRDEVVRTIIRGRAEGWTDDEMAVAILALPAAPTGDAK